MSSTSRTIRLWFSVASALALAACATTRDVPTQEFLEPISEESADLLGQIRFGLPLHESTLLLPYILDQDTPESDAWSASWDELNRGLVAMAEYSVDMIELLESDSSTASVDPMIDLLRQLHNEISSLSVSGTDISAQEYDAIAASMRQQESITEAFRLALPAIDYVTDVLRETILLSDEQLEAAVMELTMMIDERHGAIRGFGDNLAARRSQTIQLFDLLDRAWAGEELAFRELLSADWALRTELGENPAFEPRNLKTIEDNLVTRLATLADIRAHLEPAYLDYRSQLEELYSIRADLEGNLAIVNLTIDGWDNSQQQLANGEATGFAKFTNSLVEIAYRQAARK